MNKTVADLIQERFGLPSRVGHDMPAEGTVAQILSHRTHRRYKPDPVPDDVLEIVLAAALSAPSKSDLQQVAIVLVKDRAKQATIGGWIPGHALDCDRAALHGVLWRQSAHAPRGRAARPAIP